MIVMQYSFTLPADYDMAIIERRIRDNGARLDNYSGLVFKVYLYARRDDAQLPSHENLYAPLYVWQDADSMRRFFSSAGFAALTQAYGWPTVDTWLLGNTPDAEWVKTCTTAHKRMLPIPAHCSLNTMLSPDAEHPDVLQAWNPTSWQRLEVSFDTPAAVEEGTDGAADVQHYRIGYTALGSNVLA